MMLATIHTVANTYPKRLAIDHDSDLTAETATRSWTIVNLQRIYTFKIGGTFGFFLLPYRMYLMPAN